MTMGKYAHQCIGSFRKVELDSAAPSGGPNRKWCNCPECCRRLRVSIPRKFEQDGKVVGLVPRHIDLRKGGAA
jgi:hypothetical protein